MQLERNFENPSSCAPKNGLSASLEKIWSIWGENLDISRNAGGEGRTVWIGEERVANVKAFDSDGQAEHSRLLKIKLEPVDCLLLRMNVMLQFPRASNLAPRFRLHHFIFTASAAAEASVSTKIESNHSLYTTLKYVSLMRMNFMKSEAEILLLIQRRYRCRYRWNLSGSIAAKHERNFT